MDKERGVWETSIKKGNVLPLGSACNLSCYFCSNRYNPPGLKLIKVPFLEKKEVLNKIHLLNPRQTVIIGESASRFVEGEPLFHPDALFILRELRKSLPGTLIQLTTNGIQLSEEMQDSLKELEPIELIISFNSLIEGIRARFLGDPDPRRTIANFARLKQHHLHFQASFLLAPPFLPELPYSLHRVEEWGTSFIRLLLPGVSKTGPRDLQASMNDWQKLKRWFLSWRKTIKAPTLLEPPLLVDLKAAVEGVLPETAAEKAGLLQGDLILKVDDESPFSRWDCYLMLEGKENPLLLVQREKDTFNLVLRKEKGEKSGIIFSRDMNPKKLRRAIAQLPSRGNGCWLASPLARPLVQLAKERMGRKDRVLSVRSRFFGGSIRVAGLLTVDDFRRTISESGMNWDWALLPGEPFSSGEDLLGNRVEELERDFGLKVFLAS